MGLERIQRNLLVLLGIGVVALGFMISRVDHGLKDLSHILLKISEDVHVPKSASGGTRSGAQDADQLMKGDGAKVVNQKVVKSGATVFQFVQRCSGKIDLADDQSSAFCVGQNQLTLIAGDEKPVVLETEDVSSPRAAPVLRQAVLVPSKSGPGTVLLAYGADTCITANACGAGPDPLNVTFAYALGGGAGALRPIAHYPALGRSSWNPSGTRAVIIPDTCIGGACTKDTLKGYDLVSDVLQPASKETAAGSFGGVSTDASGKRVPVWGSVTWKSDTEYAVTMIDEKGKTVTVEGKF